jgi:hypothetical protein
MPGLLDWTDAEAPVDGSMDGHYRNAVATTIYGGSSEVLRILIVENRLGPPRSRPRGNWPRQRNCRASQSALSRAAHLATAQSANISKPCTAPA